MRGSKPETARWQPAIRKGRSLLKQIPRWGRRLGPQRGPGFSLMANSIPKSGTHLLVQILETVPRIRNYDTFIASIPPVRYRKRSQGSVLRRIRRVGEGELVSAHLHHHDAFRQALRAQDCLMIFIYRDPRDVVVSEAQYLTYMNPWHRVHRYFAYELGTDKERLMCAIRGIPPAAVPYRYPDVRERLAPYLPWLRCSEVCAVRFEDIMTPRRGMALERVAGFIRGRSGLEMEVDQLIEAMDRNIGPRRSRTFRAGRVGDWRTAFDESHRRAFQELGGGLLSELGYDMDAPS